MEVGRSSTSTAGHRGWAREKDLDATMAEDPTSASQIT